jgi:hypothetical protein
MMTSMLIILLAVSFVWFFVSASELLNAHSDDPIEFLNENSTPVRLLDSHKIASLFNEWNETVFHYKNIFSAFTFANFYENNILKEKTNLKNFVGNVLQKSMTENIDTYHHLSFKMPNFIRYDFSFNINS